MTRDEMISHKLSHTQSLVISEDEKVVVYKGCYVEVGREKLDVEQFNVLSVDENQIQSKLCHDGAVERIVDVEEIFVLCRTY